MGYVQLAIALFSVMSRLLELFNKSDRCNKEIAHDVNTFSNKLRDINKDGKGNTSGLEKMFRNVLSGKPANGDDISSDS